MQTLGPRLRAHLVLSVPPGLIVGHTPPGGGTLRRPEYSHPKAGAGGRRGPHQGDARGGAQGPVVFGIIVLGGLRAFYIWHMQMTAISMHFAYPGKRDACSVLVDVPVRVLNFYAPGNVLRTLQRLGPNLLAEF